MPIYLLEFFFDPGSGACLWSGNDAARDKWGCSIEAHLLPLPENTWRFAHHLCSWYDTGIDWTYPPDPSPWEAAERDRFNVAAQRFLEMLRVQLGPDFEVIDRSATSAAT